jgi:hypothetical protein
MKEKRNNLAANVKRINLATGIREWIELKISLNL